MNDLDPDQIRSRTFSQARRGYDRSEVDRFRDSVADRLVALTDDLDALQARLKQLGLEDPQDLKQEFDAVGSEVQAVLQAARRAAEEMRSRASADAARWRSEADKESRSLRDDAEDAATALRRSAWETGVELLDQAQASSEDIIRVAEQDALFIRAEAERETLRMTADARRDAEEERRTARTEAERTLLEARAESEAILAKARQSAEAAQERARALEERRAELMKELESARESIGQMEQEIDSRREALYMAGVNEPSGMRVITPDAPTPDWDSDEPGVRVVPLARFDTTEPVDADAMADEVRMLRSGDASPAEAVPAEEPVAEPVAEIAEPGDEAAEPEDEALAPTLEPVAPVAAAPESAPSLDALADQPEPLMPVAEPGDVTPPEPELKPDSPEPTTLEKEAPKPVVHEESGSAPEPVAPEESGSAPELPEPPEGRADDLSGLFASLRTKAPRQEPARPAAAATDDGSPALESSAPSPSPEAGAPQPPAGGLARSDAPAIAAATSADAFEIRDRLLLPIQNRALRTLKRRLVDLQNRVLEELRVDGVDWEPEAAMFRAAFAEELVPVRQESFIAGFTAAAELHGHAQSPPPAGSVPADAAPDFVAGLLEAITEAVHRARGSNSGTRQASSAVSKVFRAWRTDEAERRVRWSARAAYHRGVAGGLAALGTPVVTSVISGRQCASCPGCNTRTWDPAEWMSDAVPIPPATSECTATVVPATAQPSG